MLSDSFNPILGVTVCFPMASYLQSCKEAERKSLNMLGGLAYRAFGQNID
jgi:hypothetical protein